MTNHEVEYELVKGCGLTRPVFNAYIVSNSSSLRTVKAACSSELSLERGLGFVASPVAVPAEPACWE